MSDAFANHAPSLTSPATHPEAITPNDGSELGFVTRALYVGQGGSVRAMTTSGDVVTFANMQAGGIYPIRIRQVLATGTTAGSLVGLR